MIFKWRENLSLGVEYIDDQHKEMFKHIHALYNACAEGKCKSEIITLIGFLQKYIIQHFADEEELQKKYNYPDYVAHKKDHELLANKVIDFAEQMKTENDVSKILIELNQLVIEWVKKHIFIADRNLAIFLKDQENG